MNYLISAYAIILLVVFSYIIRVNIQCSLSLKKSKKIGVNPLSHSFIDKSFTRLSFISLTVLLLMTALYMAVIWAPDAIGEPPTYRIIYFHISVAILSYVGFFITFVGGILYLWKKSLRYDRWARVGADLGVHFSVLMIISGMIWGKQRWGAWWIWEPRLTTALILLITYSGYLILRHVLDSQEIQARYASVFGIIAFINVPMVRYAIKYWGSIMHPVIETTAKSPGLSPNMAFTLKFAQFAFLITFIIMYIIRLRVENLNSEILRFQSKLDEDAE